MGKMQTLNGWQRLWLIAVTAWLLAVAVHAASSFPTADQYRKTWRYYAEAQAPSMRATPSPQLWACEAAARKTAEPLGPLMNCIAAATNPTPEDRKRYAGTVAQGEALIAEELRSQQILHVVLGVLAWLVPIALLYASGLVVAWVRRGFARHP